MAAFSCESGRTKAYSSDLKWRMVYQRYSLRLSNTEVAKRLNVDPSLVLWEGPYNNLKRQAQFVAFKATYHENTCKKLSIYDELTTIEAIVNQPSLYLHEVQYIVLKTTGNNLSISTIFKFLQKKILHEKSSHSEHSKGVMS